MHEQRRMLSLERPLISYVVLLTLSIVLIASVGTSATAHAATLSPQSGSFGTVTRPSKIVGNRAYTVPFAPACSTSDNQSIYARYSSPKGTILFRVGYENTPANKGYGYCHVKAGHPEALPVIQYILDYGQVVAVTSTSFTMRGTYADGNRYQVYIVLSNNGMADGQMRGIVSAYLYTGP